MEHQGRYSFHCVRFLVIPEKMNITSAAGILSLLEEPMPEVKSFALRKLDLIVDEFWPEISEAIEKIEILHEDIGFDSRNLAALVASKVYYHLGSFEDSIRYALGAGDLFDLNSRSHYVETIIAKCIDRYTQQIKANTENPNDPKEIDQGLKMIVERMFQRCVDGGQYKQALGMAIETQRMDMFEQAIIKSNNVINMLSYAFEVTVSLIQNRAFRNTLLQCLVQLYRNLGTPDYVSMCQCLIFLDDPLVVANVLERLTKESEDSALMAYQLAFDVYESATQQFLGLVQQSLKATAPVPSATHNLIKVPVVGLQEKENIGSSTPKDENPERELDSLNEEEKVQQNRVKKLTDILSGEVSIDLHLQFLIRSNHTDLLILKTTRDAVKVSVTHTAAIIANAFMHSGTTSDHFLRDNLDWLSCATNWAKLTATASLGVIHRGHEHESLSFMQSYLPTDTSSSSGYSEGGGLYALGLIHANHGVVISDYLLEQLKETDNECVRHGGCLGLGLSAMGTNRHDICEQLRFILYEDDAVIGEAAGIAMGMVMLGSRDPQAINDMVKYSHDTQHEKIQRGLAVGIALTMYGRLEEADPLITQLCQDEDPILRRSGMYTIAMAYCGTGSNQASKKLLHVAVSDVNDDVRRAAVTSLGFILFRSPEHCFSVVSLLAESYNPHVRYGAAMALGIACAGTGLQEAISLLELMANDDCVNFVRQGALIASAMILIQHTEHTCPKVKDLRALYAKIIADKHEDVMTQFGAILAQGIIDAGGRNVSVSLQSRAGHTNMLAVVGTLVFTQYWYWFPLAHCLALAFTPTCLIALNSQLQMPKMEFCSNARPSLFAYPPPVEEKKLDERESLTTAILSIPGIVKRREAGRLVTGRVQSDSMEMEVDDNKTKAEHKLTHSEKGKESQKSGITEKKTVISENIFTTGKLDTEPDIQILTNPARVMKQQLAVLQQVPGANYSSVKDLTVGGIIMVRHLKPGTPEEIVEPVVAYGPNSEDIPEPNPPETFEYTDE